MPGRQHTAALIHGGRGVLRVLMLVCTASLFPDLLGPPEVSRDLALLGVARLAYFAMCWFVLARSSTPRAAVRVLLLATVSQALMAAVFGELRDQLNTTLLGNLALGLGCAVLIPWGWRPQALLSAISGLAVLVPAWSSAEPVYTVQAFILCFTILGVSIYLAREISATRHLAAEREVEAARAREALGRMNAELEDAIEGRTQQLEEAADEMIGFCHAVSHDLRPPLRTIDGFSQLLLESERLAADPRLLEILRSSRDIAQRAGERIDTLLADVRQAQFGLSRGEVDLSATAFAALRDLERANPDREVRWRVAPGLTATGEREALIAVVEELVRNAWILTRDREVAEIEFGSISLEGGSLGYFVSDNGAGFEVADADDLFRHTVRGNDMETGARLARVRRTVVHHGGRIWVDGAAGRGATFYFTLSDPLESSAAESGA